MHQKLIHFDNLVTSKPEEAAGLASRNVLAQ